MAFLAVLFLELETFRIGECLSVMSCNTWIILLQLMLTSSVLTRLQKSVWAKSASKGLCQNVNSPCNSLPEHKLEVWLKWFKILVNDPEYRLNKYQI